MKRDFPTLRQQYLTAKNALDKLAKDSEARPAFEKIFKQAEEMFLAHPEHPDNRAKRARRRKG